MLTLQNTILFGALSWDWSIIATTLPKFLEASLTTVGLAVVTIPCSTIIGLLVALLKLSSFKPVRTIASLYTWIFRGIPLIVQLFILYFGIAVVLNWSISPMAAAMLGTSICGGAYIAEIIRAGIESIDKGQMEAALSLGMTRGQAMRRVVIPQTYRRLIPPVSNEYIALLKDSALASTLTVNEVLRTAQVYSNATFHPLEMYLTAGVIYLLLTSLLTIIFSRVEKRLATKG